MSDGESNLLTWKVVRRRDASYLFCCFVCNKAAWASLQILLQMKEKSHLRQQKAVLVDEMLKRLKTNCSWCLKILMVFKRGKLSVPRGLVERSSTPKGCLTLFVCSLSLTTGLWVKTRNKAHLCSRIEQNYYTQHVICGPLSVMVSSGSSWRWKILSTRSWAISKAEQQNVQP